MVKKQKQIIFSLSLSGWLKQELKKPKSALLSKLSLVVLQRHAQHPLAYRHWGRKEENGQVNRALQVSQLRCPWCACGPSEVEGK